MKVSQQSSTGNPACAVLRWLGLYRAQPLATLPESNLAAFTPLRVAQRAKQACVDFPPRARAARRVKPSR